ncbi:MAG TPA: cytochrome c3 family protein [Thermoanaerobaculia bacterium]
MKTRWLVLAAAAALLAPFAAAAESSTSRPTKKPAPTTTCIDCHLALDDPSVTPPAKLFQGDDVHAKAGFTCVFCHGGDGAASDQELAHDKKKGFIGKPAPRDIPQVCGKCHSDAAVMKQFNPSLRVDQLAEYRTSGHGKKLAEGDTHVAQCASCHGAHGILPVKDSRSPVATRHIAETCKRCHGDAALMATYKLPSDVYSKYTKSVHYQARVKGDLSAPTCNSCHGNHGAAPPEVGSVANVCGTCHATFAEQFKVSPHWEAFKELGLPGCVTCHENHEIVRPTEAFLSEGSESRCSSCHEPSSPGGKAAAEMRADLLSLATETQQARQTLERAAEAGMEVSKIRFSLSQADDALTRARASIHRFQVAAVRENAAAGLSVAKSAHQAANRALAERDYRRRGLFVSLALILATIASLLAAIRERERRRSERGVS